MKPSLQKLHKFFKLEAERGYDNHAVLGGLDRMLDRWEAEARAEAVPDDLIQAVVSRIRDYSRLTTVSRAEVLEGLMKRIQRVSGSPVSSPSGSIERDPIERQESGEAPAILKETGFAAEEAAGSIEKETGPVDTRSSIPSSDSTGNRQPDTPGAGYPASRSATTSSPTGPPAALDASITVLPGVGPRHAQTLNRLGLKTLRDMLYYFPRRYDDYSQLKPINRLWYGEEVTVIGTVQSVNARPVRSGRAHIVEAVVSDGSGALRITWFNQIWIAKRLQPGAHIVIAGKIDQYLGRLVMNNPEWEPLEQQQLSTNRIVPVYPLTAQITQRWLRRLLNQVVSYWSARVQDPLPPSLRQAAGLVDLPTALLQAHFPDSWDSLKAARQRLAFDEIFLLQLGVLSQKRAWQERTARVFDTGEDWLQAQVGSLPFPLTGAQERALQDVRNDLACGRPMNRLLQGDVGSGKTVIAALAIAMVVKHGAQAAFMAPTSILAEQHYKSSLKLLAGGETQQPVEKSEDEVERPQANQAANSVSSPLRPEEIRLMVGATSESEKREIREGLAQGSIKLVIGTHALIEDPVTFANLELAIVDEQHRFGVDQRALLRSKGENPHLLVMTATPIPRSLALTIYGDLDLSVMDEMPPGRQPVSTFVLTPNERERAYSLVKSQIEQGRQAFMIFPLVEESETIESKAAVEEHARLQSQIFPKLKLGLLHGRMKPDDKDEVMTRFRDGDYHIIVSTSVVEVGVDVPNATVMLIEGANRFGLAQLHQFRGRVGRGSDKAYCLLIPDTVDAVENERLQAMVETNDGFVLAERDLEQRGPGQFLGTRQSGYSELQLASLTDVHLIEKARRHAQMLFKQDANLSQPEHKPIAMSLERFWGSAGGDIS